MTDLSDPCLASLSFSPALSNIMNLEPTSSLSRPSHLVSSDWTAGVKSLRSVSSVRSVRSQK